MHICRARDLLFAILSFHAIQTSPHMRYVLLENCGRIG